MRPHLRAALLISITAWATAGCDFFRELESLPEAGEDESGDGTDELGDETDGSDETGDEPCTVLDEHCSDQDTLHACNVETGELDTYHCAALCQGALNFTCTPTPDFRHACWCVTPGEIKIDTCAQLEACVDGCGGDPASACTSDCFTRTDSQTVRLLGTLYSCADRACDDLCADSPADCGACLIAARAGLWGDCGLAREVCDADAGDEPNWP